MRRDNCVTNRSRCEIFEFTQYARTLYVQIQVSTHFLIHTTMETLSTDRINARVPREQKKLFERAAQVGGFRNLTDFILDAAQQKADSIIREHQAILATERDQQIFFQEITNPSKANQQLQKAAIRYNEQVTNT